MAVKMTVLKESEVSLVTESFLQSEDVIKEVSLHKVKFWKDNPRKNDKGVPRLAKLLRVYGQVSPIVVWEKNNVVYKGNTTLKALQSIGAKTVKVLYKSFPSEAAAIAYGIADNKSSEWSDWDEGLLKEIFTSNREYYNVSTTGFTEKEQKSFLLSMQAEKLPDVDIQGESKDLGEFMIITFDSKETMIKFKKLFNIPTEHRKIDFSILSKKLVHTINSKKAIKKIGKEII